MSKRVFLCITDLHYQDQKANFPDDPKDIGNSFGGSYRSNSLQKLKTIINLGFAKGDLDFIAVAGDITTAGKKSGFEDFARDLVPLLTRLVPDQALCIVPGNHDIRWKLDPYVDGYYDLKFADFVHLVEGAHATSCLLPRGEVKGDPAFKTSFISPTHGPLYTDSQKKIIVLNINSALRCGELHKPMCDDFGSWAAQKIDFPAIDSLSKYFVRDIAQFTPEQLEALQEILSRKQAELGPEWGSYLKVALVHHHVVHFPDQITEHKGYEFMLDSSLLLGFLTSFDFDLVLTGHKHHPYEMVHHYKDKQIFIVGGPTVGGFESHGTFRGMRLFEFEDDGFTKKLNIRDVKEDFSQSNVRNEIRKASRTQLSIDWSLKERFEHAASEYGYSYQDIVVTTKISSSGDAFRSVNYKGLVVTKNCSRLHEHDVFLPSTSGYVDTDLLRPLRSTIDYDVINSTPRSLMPKAARMRLQFRPPLSLNQDPASYSFEWPIFNGFALSKLQFRRMHAAELKDNPALPVVEYTHFQTSAPADTLTLVVLLPDEFDFNETVPYVRVAKPDPSIEDSRLWELDQEATRQLSSQNSLRVFPSLNLAELLVKSPNPNRSYRVEWKLPEGAKKRYADRVPEAIRKIQNKTSYSQSFFSKMFAGVREVFLQKWNGELDIAFMVFGSEGNPGVLKTFAAMRCNSLTSSDDPSFLKQLIIKTSIPYGMGVAGRAFRANKIQYHASSDIDLEADKNESRDFYLPFEDSLEHKRLICFPLHLPATEDEFHSVGDFYATSEPFGIVNIGSNNKDCPLPRDEKDLSLQGDNAESRVKSLQHQINQALAKELDQPKTVQKVSRRRHL